MEARSGSLVRVALRVWTAIGAVVLLAAAWWLFREPIRLVGPPIAIGIILVYLLNPAVSGLERRGVVRPIGTLLVYVVGLAASVIAVWLVGPVLVEQARGLLDELPAIGVSIQDSVNQRFEVLGLPPDVRLDLQAEVLTQQLRDLIATNQEQALGLLRGASSVVSWVLHLTIAVTLGPILAFYALADLPRLSAGVRRLLPPDRRPEAVEVATRIGGTVGAYFRGQLLVATFVGTATAIGLALVGLPFWAVVGVTSGVFNLIPLVGPVAGGVFGVLIALTVGGGLQQAVLVVVVMVVVQQVDNHLITPMVVSRSVAVHPITVIVTLIVAGSLGGIPAMFIAVPAVAAAKLVLLHVVVTRVPSMAHVADDPEDEGPARRGTLANLAQDLRHSFERRLAFAAASQRDDGAETSAGAAAGGGAGGDARAAAADPGGAGPDDRSRSDAGERDDLSPPAGVAPPT